MVHQQWHGSTLVHVVPRIFLPGCGAEIAFIAGILRAGKVYVFSQRALKNDAVEEIGDKISDADEPAFLAMKGIGFIANRTGNLDSPRPALRRTDEPCAPQSWARARCRR